MKQACTEQSRSGFTLIELLVTISIITVLSTIGLSTFSGIQSKARDSIRKNDLRTLATALEIYSQNNDGKYVEGKVSCQTNPDPGSNTFYQAIKNYLSDPDLLPKDPLTKQAYCYISDSGGYRLFAKLENLSDADIISGCTNYNYSVVSLDLTLICPP